MTSVKAITKTLSRVIYGRVRRQKSLDTHAKRDRRHHEALLEKPMSELYEFLFCPVHGMVWAVIFSLTGQDFRGTIAVTVGLVKSKWRSK